MRSNGRSTTKIKLSEWTSREKMLHKESPMQGNWTVEMKIDQQLNEDVKMKWLGRKPNGSRIGQKKRSIGWGWHRMPNEWSGFNEWIWRLRMNLKYLIPLFWMSSHMINNYGRGSRKGALEFRRVWYNDEQQCIMTIACLQNPWWKSSWNHTSA